MYEAYARVCVRHMLMVDVRYIYMNMCMCVRYMHSMNGRYVDTYEFYATVRYMCRHMCMSVQDVYTGV